jgi:SAM-dependent methyltransferase
MWTRSVLVIGSATCREVIFIRHRWPTKRILCADFEGASLPNIESALEIEFGARNFNARLADNGGQFDVVFSSHVLEHLFDPNRTSGLARRGLTPNGQLIAAVPLRDRTCSVADRHFAINARSNAVRSSASY